MAPPPDDAGGAAAWLLAPPLAARAVDLTVLWGGTILAFLAGVRRGLSFLTPAAARPRRSSATSLGLFALGFAA